MNRESKVFSTILAFIVPAVIGVLYFIESNLHLDELSQITIFQNRSEMISEDISLRKAVLDRKLESINYERDSDDIHYVHPVKKEGWELIWQDEFEFKELNKDKWNVENWAAEKNNELQFYTPNNVVVEDGILNLLSKRESYNGREYTSGAIHSKDKFSFRYGKVEMRAKLPSGQGIFPAFWMMPNVDETWLPEIDIMEMLGHKPDEIWMVLHWLNDQGELTTISKMHKGNDYSKDFHTYSVEWSPTKISWFIDDVEKFSTDAFIPHVDMYLYLNTAVGGNWPGSPDETTIFPQIYEVDYVRVYQEERGNE
ncbi:glycoside hydrolase family 16 protein [Evansella sp. AB-P1]|uniref:glycoside hydrolase family 16 protein n=1 Tax=Evansella sp. AB-P1 TaxID=3037653 RepID=UPI00241D930D|nr:glycoside hydrolase family 16 protein [Evansella sp. AB-P1]MDG5786355.1 glycoside hydrolase family 16 protein [Evansella sp. AB-P1]